MLIDYFAGNVGLGKETIIQLSHHNPSHIYLGARTESKALAAIKDIQSLVPNARITFLPCDLTSLKSVQACARKFVAIESRLDILILNAGVMALPPGTTEDGYEIQFGTNHMGHALLAKLLLPTLVKTAEEPGADVRVVVLSSVGHVPAWGISFAQQKTDMKSYSTWSRYAESKLANILFAKELAKRYKNITAVSLNPGLVDTDLFESVFGWFGPLRRAVESVKGLVFVKVQEGAKNSLWAATAPLEGKDASTTGRGVKSGVYYMPIGVDEGANRAARDPALAEKLWEWTEKELEGWEL